MRVVRTPAILRRLFYSATWKNPSITDTIYLTFDDGPIPGVTPWVLDTLNEYDAKATFFCIGKNVTENAGIYHRIIKEGHSIGNHTMHHLNGWKVKNQEYFHDIQLASEVINSTLFRPPYGKLRLSQYRALRKRYNIVLWDVLSYDFDKGITKEKCLNNVLSNAKQGSIIVFHDSLKAEENMRYALVETLKHFSTKGFKFLPIT